MNPEAVASKGIIEFGQIQIHQKPNTKTSMRFVFTGLELFGNKIDDFLEPKPLHIQARNCSEGESYGEALTCLPCLPGFVLYKNQEEPGFCEPCLETEKCYGSNSTAPAPGYWRSFKTSQNYIECLNPDACLGGDEYSPLGECE